MTTTRIALEKLVAGVSTRANLISYFNTNADIIDAYLAKSNWNAGALDPDADNDDSEGYATGSRWYTTTAIWECVDASTGGAVWRQVWPVTAVGGNVDFGAYEIRAQSLNLDLADGGAAPMTITSAVKVANLNVDLLDGLHDTAFLKHSLATAANDFLVASESGAFVKKTLSEAQTILAMPLKADLTTKGDMWAATAASTPARLGVGTNGQTLIADIAQAAGLSWADLMTDGVYRQALVNGSFQISQRATVFTSATTPANSDDTYLIDRWILLSDGNDIVDVSQDASVVPTGGAASAKFEVETQNKKFGILQIIESKDSIRYAGKTASLQFKARTVTGKVIENIRVAVLSWSSTGDVVTSDVVASWGAEGANPTLAANWTAENVPANMALVADTWTIHKIENISIDTASMANLAVFIWVDDTDAVVDDLLYISDVQLNAGAVCLPFLPRDYKQELAHCTYFYWKDGAAGKTYHRLGTGIKSADGNAQIMVFHPEMRCAAISIDVSGTFCLYDGTTIYTCNAISLEGYTAGKYVTLLISTMTDALADWRNYQFAAENDTAAYIAISAEL